jgi:hypothetical protein
MSKITAEDRAESAARLIEDYGLTDGATVYAIVRSVSASGMSRSISLFAISDSGIGSPYLYNITYHVARGLGESLRDTKYGERVIRVHGAGMDMVFATVYDLSIRLHGNGYALKHNTL